MKVVVRYAGLGAADALGIGERPIERFSGGVLLDGDQCRNADAFLEELAHAMARALRRDHRHVDARRWRDLAEMDVEPVGEHQHLARGHIRKNRLVVDFLLRVIRNHDHDDVGFFGGFRNRLDAKSLGPGLVCALASLVKPDNNLKARITEIQRMRMSLAAITDDGDRLAKQWLKAGILIVVDRRGH